MLESEIKDLKGEVVKYSGLIENMLNRSVLGLLERKDSYLFEVIKEMEERANDKEIELDNKCIELLAKYAPKATALRTIMIIMKMVNDLERMADHCVNISRSALEVIEEPELKASQQVHMMLEDVIIMINGSIKAFIDFDIENANKVCEMDNKVNKLRDEVLKEMLHFMTVDSSYVERAVNMINISRNLERIADLATNIAEDTIYMIGGKSIKHKNS